jgi:hypothetical protein
MVRRHHVAILSDIHYAGPGEAARGDDYEWRGITNPLLRLALRAYRRFIWLPKPTGQNHLLNEFIARAGSPDFVVANGDFSCNSNFLGVSDDDSCESARLCLDQLRRRFAPNFQATIGDHELGKLSLALELGGMRLASWHRARRELGLAPFWRVELGRYVLLGVASSLLALPVYEPDTLPAELPEWRRLREEHLAEICAAFAALTTGQRVLLFCHDPTALPFLWREEAVRQKLPQIEQTIIGHLHSNLVFWKSRRLAGMPVIRFLGPTVRRMSAALSEARHWRPFKVRLCPSLAGIQLLKDGGYYTVELDADPARPAQFQFHPLPR